MSRLAPVLAALLLLLFVCGCGRKEGPPLAPVSGTVTLDGKPLVGAQVNFYCPEHRHLATGVTDSSGRYELYGGAAIGVNKVWIVLESGSEANPVPGGDPAENPDLDPAQLEAQKEPEEGRLVVKGGITLPARFSSSEQTVLKFQVPQGGTSKADFPLTSR